MKAAKLHELCATLNGLTYEALHDARVLRRTEGQGEAARDWHNFDSNPVDFIVRLDAERLEALAKLIKERQK